MFVVVPDRLSLQAFSRDNTQLLLFVSNKSLLSEPKRSVKIHARPHEWAEQMMNERVVVLLVRDKISAAANKTNAKAKTIFAFGCRYLKARISKRLTQMQTMIDARVGCLKIATTKTMTTPTKVQTPRTRRPKMTIVQSV